MDEIKVEMRVDGKLYYTNENRECECHLCEKRDDCFIAFKFQRLPRNPDGTGGLGMCPKL